MTKIEIEKSAYKISLWVKGACLPDVLDEIANEASFKHKPFFGAKKKRMKLMMEVCCLNTAIAIHAANCAFPPQYCKPIIQGFLQNLQKYMFSILVKHNSEFEKVYSLRMAEYFEIFHGEDIGISLSFAFLKNLHDKTQLNFEGQVAIGVRFGKLMTDFINGMNEMGHDVA